MSAPPAPADTSAAAESPTSSGPQPADPTVYESVLMLELTELKQKTAQEMELMRKHIETQQLMIGQLRSELKQMQKQQKVDGQEDEQETRMPGTMLLRDTPEGAAAALGLTHRRPKQASQSAADSTPRIISAEGNGIVRPRRTSTDRVDTCIMVFASVMLLLVLGVAIGSFFLPWIKMPDYSHLGTSPRRAPTHNTPFGRNGAGYKG